MERQRLLTKLTRQQRVRSAEPSLCFRNVSLPFCDLGAECHGCHGLAELWETGPFKKPVAYKRTNKK